MVDRIVGNDGEFDDSSDSDESDTIELRSQECSIDAMIYEKAGHIDEEEILIRKESCFEKLFGKKVSFVAPLF